MVIFDSAEYWQSHTWDRYVDLRRVPRAVKAEFLRQEELTISKLLPLLNGKGEFRIMDLACGPGRIADSVLQATSSKSNISMTLVDFNSGTLELARENVKGYQNVSFLVATAYEIGNVFDRCFDAVICLELLHHISDLDLLFGQIARVLKPGGILIGNVFALESYAEWDKLKHGSIKSLRRRLLCSLSEVFYGKSPDAVKRIIRRLGLARISPLSREELVASLESHFESFEIATSYYYWFSARGAR